MSKRTRRTVRGAFAALVAAGLTFGAGSVFAAPDARRFCDYDPANGRIGLSCTFHDTCVAACTEWWGSWNPGICGGGCCICSA